MELKFNKNELLPKLSWVAKINKASEVVDVEHGASVETNDSWLVEGVWDGSFTEAQFHKSYNFFGSGLKIEGDSVYFVSSSALVDRLILCEFQKEIFVSNSLILMLAVTNAKLDPEHDYLKESIAILKGLMNYESEFKISHPQIKYFKQIFCSNIIYSENNLKFEKRIKFENIANFDEYISRMNAILDLIGSNYRDSARNIKMDAYTTVSQGYDSTAVSSLVKKIGVKTAFTCKTPLAPLKSKFKKLIHYKSEGADDGTAIGKSLGYKIRDLNSESSDISNDELFFLSTICPKFASVSEGPFVVDGKKYKHIYHWSEISHHMMTKFIEKQSSAAILFTGYHGDSVWEKKMDSKYLKKDIIRQGVDGLSLSEIRLKAGFINIAAPFILASNIKNINQLSNSEEMEPWSVGNKNYDRPIPRRIAESAGVERNKFGIEKNFIVSQYFFPIDRKLRKDFFNHLKAKHNIGKITIYNYIVMSFSVSFLLYILRSVKLTNKWFYPTWFTKKYDFYYLMNHWAFEKLSVEFQEYLTMKYTIG